jgi:pimeloyl-ACP methyl ester carboxylesterase
MISGRAPIGGGLELAYDVFGRPGAEARTDPRRLVLVMGIGAQRIFWDAEMIAQFVAAGFQVVRFDHREIGESSRLPREAPVPRIVPTLLRRLVGLPIEAPYTLSTMADDVVALLDTLGWADAHVVGVSLGGMVGQHLAIEHPDRVRSLTAIMTTPGARRYLPQPHALRALLFSKPPQTAAESGQAVAAMFAAIGSRAWRSDPARLRALGEAAFARGTSPRGFLRHFAATLASGDRAARLPSVRAPTLVIHGTADPMFPLAAGKKLAALIPRATWLPIAGMGHDMPPALWPTLVAAIARHAERAEPRATV